MSRNTLRGLAVALLFVALTAVMTWPQARYLGTRVLDSDDPLLSIWRISWIAHILPKSPLDILNGNIFYPEPRTLAYTDSVLLQGAVSAPLIWSGLSPVTTYNLVLLLSMALSGWAMWRYARYLTGHEAAAILAGLTFAFVPFRFDHLHHLELQATVFIPLTLLFYERALQTGSRRDVWLMMTSFVLQVYSGIYYSIFLATALGPAVSWRLWRAEPAARQAFLRAALPAGLAALVVMAPYLWAYSLNRATLGERLDRDILLYSATLANYLATPEGNVVHGWWSRPLGQSERLLFPGFLALGLAAVGLGFDRQRVTVITVGLIGFGISFGLHSPVYEVLRTVIFPYRGLRAPARASILVFMAIAALVAYGWARLLRGRSTSVTVVATSLMAAAMLGEYRTKLDWWLTLPERPPEVYEWLARQPRLVVAEVPFARIDELHSIADGLYMYNSTRHWQPIVNGYSGFFPRSFLEAAEAMEGFPDDRSIAYLKARGVDVLVIHGALLGPEKFGEMTARLLSRRDIEALAQFHERMGSDAVFRLRR